MLAQVSRVGSEATQALSDSSGDLKASDAIMEGNVNLAAKLIRENEVSYKQQNQILSQFLDSNNLESAVEIAIAMCHHDRAEDMKLGTKELIMTLLKSLQRAGQVDNIKKFINSLGYKTNLLIRGHIWVKTSLIKCDPEAFVELLYTEQVILASHWSILLILASHWPILFILVI